MDCIQGNFCTIFGDGLYPKVSEEFMLVYGECAPIHISEDVARRCCATLVIELLWHFDLVCA